MEKNNDVIQEKSRVKKYFWWMLKTAQKNIVNCFTSWSHNFWVFDENGNLVRWIKKYPWFTQKWKFCAVEWPDKIYNVLVDGKQINSEWSIKNWKFDQYWRLIEWKLYDAKSGTTWEWTFNAETGQLTHWKILYNDWTSKII